MTNPTTLSNEAMRVSERGESNDPNDVTWTHQCTSVGELGPNFAFVSKPTNCAKVELAISSLG